MTCDDETPLPTISAALDGNRRLLAIIGDLYLEARQRTVALREIYEMVRALGQVAPRAVAERLLIEERKRAEGAAANIAKLEFETQA